MDIDRNMEIVYPRPKPVSLLMSRLRTVFGWTFLIGGAACLLVNYLCGGKAWSLVSVWSMFMVWALVFQQPLVEKNVISQGVKLLITASILIVLIDVFLTSGGWSYSVVPIVWYGVLTVLGVLFFTNTSKQRHNIMPLIWMTAASVAASAVAIFVYSDRSWPILVLGCVSAVLFIVCMIVLKIQFFVELKKRFHIK